MKLQVVLFALVEGDMQVACSKGVIRWVGASSAFFTGPGFPAPDRTALLTTWMSCVPAALAYDTLCSLAASTVAAGGGTCYDSNGSDTATNVATSPAVGLTWYFLVRADNGCPGVGGPLGSQSSGTPRTGLACP